jgi:hypothetical protein
MAGVKVLLLLLVAMTAAGCELAGDIFEAGVWVGMFMIALVVGVIAFVIAKIRT